MRLNFQRSQGITLIELMIVVAIIAVISAIAIPAYQGYIQEAKYGAARASIDSLKIFLEDYKLENGTYALGGSATPDTSDFGWEPNNDDSGYQYAITSAASNTYVITVTDAANAKILDCNQSGSCNYY